jgi:hypothetical protein
VLEKAGKPAVGIVAAGFERNAMATAKAFGLPEFRYARVGAVLTGLVPQQIEQEVHRGLRPDRRCADHRHQRLEFETDFVVKMAVACF